MERNSMEDSKKQEKRDSLDACEMNVSNFSLVEIRPDGSCVPSPTYCNDDTYGWDSDERYVYFPFSTKNNFNGTEYYKIIRESLKSIANPLHSYKQIQECIKSYQNRTVEFDALAEFFDRRIDNDLRDIYLTSVIPFMVKLALQAPSTITQPIPILRTGELICLTMSHVQVATLLSLAFFCTYPTHRFVRATSAFNFDELFDLRTKRAVEKLCCILHYFHHISKNMPSGIMKFRRQHADPLDWSNLSVPLSPLHVEVKGTIEDSEGMLHVDFANKFIGGGVLSFGCVQEEIRFLICPELIVSMLFCQVMKANEAIVITNSIRFSDYVGYAHSFEWRPRTKIEKINRDCSEIHSELVAIDAFSFRNRSAQFQKKFVDRELLKAYVGYLDIEKSHKAVATGNWGCGVYHGNVHLKSMIQLLACSINGRPMCYFTFNDRIFAGQLTALYGYLKDYQITVGQLYDLLLAFCSQYDYGDKNSLFDFIISNISEHP